MHPLHLPIWTTEVRFDLQIEKNYASYLEEKKSMQKDNWSRLTPSKMKWFFWKMMQDIFTISSKQVTSLQNFSMASKK